MELPSLAGVHRAVQTAAYTLYVVSFNNFACLMTGYNILPTFESAAEVLLQATTSTNKP